MDKGVGKYERGRVIVRNKRAKKSGERQEKPGEDEGFMNEWVKID